MSATVIGRGAIEIVSTAMDILIPIAVIVHVLAHLNMTCMLQSADERNKTGRRVTGTVTAQAYLRHHFAASDEMTIVTNARVEVLPVITMVASVASERLSVSGHTLAEPIHAKQVSACWTTAIVEAGHHQRDAVVRAMRARTGVIVTPRYVSWFILTCTILTLQRARYSPRADRKSKTPVPEPAKKEEEDRTLRSGSEEGEIEED